MIRDKLLREGGADHVVVSETVTITRGAQYQRQQGGVDRGQAGAGEALRQPGEGAEVGTAQGEDQLGLLSPQQSLHCRADHLTVLYIFRLCQSIQKDSGRPQLDL